MEKKSFVQQRLELAEQLPPMKIKKRNEPNLQRMAEAVYNHMYNMDI